MADDKKAPKYHRLKTWPPYFQWMLDGQKTFELRKNDRGFEQGDHLVLEEWLPGEKEYTGRVLVRKVGVVVYGAWGLEEDTCAMSLLPEGTF